MARTLVVEADGASRGNAGPASYGALVADADADAATGEVLVELAEPLGVTTDNGAVGLAGETTSSASGSAPGRT
jgi:ribonuclease HI